MQLLLRFSGFAESYKTTLVGMERGRYLICSAPYVPGIWTVLNAADQTTVRYLCEGVVYGFKCTLLTALDKPFRLLVLSYPENIETVNLRQHQRIPCLIPAKAKVGARPGGTAPSSTSASAAAALSGILRRTQEAAVSSGDEIEDLLPNGGFVRGPGRENQSDERQKIRQSGDCRRFVRRVSKRVRQVQLKPIWKLRRTLL